MGRIIKGGKHTAINCSPPPYTLHGAIWECDCGRRWKHDANVSRWYQTWPSSFGIRRHNKVEGW